jgi:signal transduction histidine kinase
MALMQTTPLTGTRSSFWNDLSIQLKLRLGFGLMIALLVAFAAAMVVLLDAQYHAFDKLTKAQEKESLNAHILDALLEARHSEQDFLLRYENQGYQAAYFEYVIEFQGHMNALQSRVPELKAVSDAEQALAITSVENNAQVYRDAFLEVADEAIATRGTANTGLLGKLNDHLENLTAVTHASGDPELDLAGDNLAESFQLYNQAATPGRTVLVDFIPAFAQARFEVRKQIQGLAAAVEAADLTPEQRDEVIADLSVFGSRFEELARLDVRIATKQATARGAAQIVEPILEKIGADLDVITRDAQASLDQTEQNIRYAEITAVVVGLILGLSLALSMTRGVVRPLRNLTQVAGAIAQGDYAQRAIVAGKDEMGQLAQSFNTMAEAVQVRERELTDLNTNLEKRVRERTIELQQATALAKESARLKSEFLATMSHELRTPLNAIEGFTSIMLGNMGIELNPQARKMVERVAVNSKRLLTLINDFLDISRIESGRYQLAHTPISLAQLAEKWQHQVSLQAESKGLALTFSIDPSLPAMLYGDEESLSRVVLNLLTNAIKFTKQGSVRLSMCYVDPQHWAIEVADTGIGIPFHAREYIFDEFRQADQSSKREFGGAGLGLAIVQKLTRLMGGTVVVQSEVGQGSTFIVTLPIHTVAEALQGEVA